MGIVQLRPRVPGIPTLADYAGELDARRYLCPPQLDVRIDRLLDPTGTARVLAITGRRGIGKTAALREVRRRAARAGYRVVWIDAREDDVWAALERVDSGAHVVLIDGLDLFGAARAGLGRALVALPQETRVVLAARSLPARWLPEQVEPLAWSVRLVALSPEAADQVLVRHGVDDGEARRAIAERSAGLPLALVVHARAWVAGGPGDLDEIGREGEEGLLDHLADAAFDRLDPELRALLAVSASVDRRLVAEVFGCHGQEMVEELRSSGVVETVGERWVLHPSLADLVSQRLRREEPERARAAILRVADHEFARADAGEAAALTRLASLLTDPGLRAGMGPTALLRYYADHWRSGDAAVVRHALEHSHPGAWQVISAWVGEEMRVVRRVDGCPVALVAALPLASANRISGPRRQLIAPVVEHARASGTSDRVVLSAVQLTFADQAEPEVAWVRNAAGLALAGIGNPRGDHVNLFGDAPEERDALAAYGYTEVPPLRRCVGGVTVTTWSADAGPGGLAGMLHAAVVSEQGGAVPAGDADLVALVEGFADASEPTRAWIRARVRTVLADEPLLHDLVTRRYLTPGATHESVMRSTYLSRATYFRRLRRARDLLDAAGRMTVGCRPVRSREDERAG